MIEIITAENIHLYQTEMDEAYRLRHDVFVDEKGWNDLARADRREIDQFDNEHAVHMICRRDGKVVGYQRMLPTTKPHLLSSVLSDLCEVDQPIGNYVWEWTRYCVAKPYRERGRTLSPVANALLSAIVEWGMGCGVDHIIIEMEPIWLLRLVQLNFMVTPLGIPREIDGSSVVAVVAKFDHRTLGMLQTMRGNDEPALMNNYPARIVAAE